LPSEDLIVRARCYFTGIVQGVGFRPTLARLAREEKLVGWVLNSTTGVTCEVEGTRKACESFFRRVHEEAPRLAKITSSFIEFLPPVGFSAFSIKESREEEGEITLVSADTAICADCARELLDPQDRRYRYPFINCTNCGPRYSIIEDLPYDRPNTTMRDFPMCDECRSEYEDPNNRRYHAQPNACPKCGPQVFLTTNDGDILLERDEAISGAVKLLASGAIVAVKGIGGFHLACDAFNNSAVEELRQRKRRARFKPFAIMVKDFSVLREIAEVKSEELALLSSPMSPIVLVNKRLSATAERISPMVAPRTRLWGVMIPYSPLHLLLFNTFVEAGSYETLEILVMTSANLSEEPLVYDNDDALFRLSDIADYFLMHNRRIVAPSDDSIVRFIGGIPRTLRIGRGYAPYPVALVRTPEQKAPKQCVLGFGAELKSTFAITAGRFALISPHLGDMENVPSQALHEKTLSHFQRVFRVKPKVVVADKHPLYYSRKLAEALAQREDANLLLVQHHFAHLVSSARENGISGRVISLSFDGTGYGDDGKIWGAEVLVGDDKEYKRRATIYELPLPGGEASIHETWRLGLSALFQSDEALLKRGLEALRRISLGEKAELVAEMLSRGISLVPSSSLGRLFDAFSSLLGICLHATYEAQAAIELEMMGLAAEKAEVLGYKVLKENDLYVLDWRPAVVDALQALGKLNMEPFVLNGKQIPDSPYLPQIPVVSNLSLGFMIMLVRGFTEITAEISEEEGVDAVVLTGGCFQNKVLLEEFTRALTEKGLKVFSQSGIPANDAGVSLGQLAHGISVTD